MPLGIFLLMPQLGLPVFVNDLVVIIGSLGVHFSKVSIGILSFFLMA
jgi:hypothetical protein